MERNAVPHILPRSSAVRAGEVVPMPNDAKLGMVFGVGLVVLIAALFFRKDGGGPVAAESASVAVAPSPTPGQKNRTPRKHRIREGDTLAGISRLYFNTETRVGDIRRANDLPPLSEDLPAGRELIIPEGTDALN